VFSFLHGIVSCHFVQIHDPRFPQTEARKSRGRISHIQMEESESESESEDEEDETIGLLSDDLLILA